MTEREAFAVEWPADEDGATLYLHVGSPIHQVTEPGVSSGVVGAVTRIVVSDDLPGLHCYMERVRVYVDDLVVYEAPVHAVQLIQYRVPPPTDQHKDART